MEVDRNSFQSRLLGILTALSDAHFVSLDLELSGVPSKHPNSSRHKQTLEERYKEVKEAAERYQVLQIGLTCVEQDLEKDVYTVRPYNFNLNPLVEERLDIERIFAYQSGAVEFLLNHGFRMELPFTMGVPYLSRDEAKLAEKLAYDRLDKTNIEDLYLKDDDIQSLEFVKRAREKIIAWKTLGKDEYLNITSSIAVGVQQTLPELSRFEKRLVHQLVRAEFPELVTISKPTFIKIIPLDEVREANIKHGRKLKVKEQIIKQTGFRWVVEAMAGGDFNKLDVKSLARSHSGDAQFVDLDDLRARFDRARENLKARRPVLVGHNMFTDLVYFYRCFIGELPQTVHEFQRAIHKLFPVVVDTKYMATHNCGDINPASSLEQIEERLRRQKSPVIETHRDHLKYRGTEAFHEAGYDSLLTANIMIRLSAKLKAEGTYIRDISTSDDDGPYITAPEDAGGISLLPEDQLPRIDGFPANNGLLTTAPEQTTTLTAPSMSASSGIFVDPAMPSNHPQAFAEVKVGKKKRKKKKSGATKATEGGRYAHMTMFDQLRSMELSADEDPIPEGPPKALGMDWIKAAHTGLATASFSAPQVEKKASMTLMPPFNSGFWRVYGNKLRIFGTAETVLKLTG